MMKSFDRELSTIDLSKYVQEMTKKSKEARIPVEEPPEEKKQDSPSKKKESKQQVAKRGSIKTTSKRKEEKGDSSKKLLVTDHSVESKKSTAIIPVGEKFNRPKILFYGDPEIDEVEGEEVIHSFPFVNALDPYRPIKTRVRSSMRTVGDFS